MRIKIILPAFALAGAILVLAFYYRSTPATEPTAANASQPPVAGPSVSAVPSAFPNGMTSHAIIPAASRRDDFANFNDPAPPPGPDYALQRTAELNQLAASDDPANLQAILSELGNPDPAIRKAALRATVDFGSTDAIPALSNAMAAADDPQEKVDILKAINFLQLPRFQPDNQQAAASTTTP
jgi:HEAT repeat protein